MTAGTSRVACAALAAALWLGPGPGAQPGGDASASACDASVICPGEELLYEVSWGPFHLGRIRLHTLESAGSEGGLQHSATVRIDSYSEIPFVDVHAVEQTWMDSGMFSRGFRSSEKKDDRWLSETSHYDSARRVLIIRKQWQKDVDSPPWGSAGNDTLAVGGAPFHDGLSILYFARAHARTPGRITVPIVVYGKSGTTTFRFRAGVSEEETALFSAPLRAVEFEGRADFEGLFGLTGEFRGWCTDDPASVPIRAELNVVIGSIAVELKSCRRPGWNVPFARAR